MLDVDQVGVSLFENTFECIDDWRVPECSQQSAVRAQQASPRGPDLYTFLEPVFVTYAFCATPVKYGDLVIALAECLGQPLSV